MSGQQIEISMEDYESLRMQFPNLTHGELLGLHLILNRLRFYQEALSSNEIHNRLTLLESNHEALIKRVTEVEQSKKQLQDENEDLKKQLDEMKKQDNEK